MHSLAKSVIGKRVLEVFIKLYSNSESCTFVNFSNNSCKCPTVPIGIFWVSSEDFDSTRRFSSLSQMLLLLLE